MKFNSRCKSLNPYTLSNRFDGKNEKIYLDWNESTKIFSDRLQIDISNSLKKINLNYYGDNNCSQLREALSKYIFIPQSYISVFNGSDSALNTAFECILNPEDKVLKIEPEYSQIDTFIHMKGSNVFRAKYNDIFSIDINNIINDIKSNNIRVVYLSNPNNPTGRIIPKNDIEKIISLFKETWFLIDEAYVEFYGKSVVDLTKKYINVIVFRSFSKAFSLAGIRIGYIVSNEDNIKIIDKVRNGKEVSPFSQLIASNALRYIDDLESHISKIKYVKSKTTNSLSKINGLNIIDTKSNYFLIKSKHNYSIVDYLNRNNILIRDRSSMHGLTDCSRVSIGTMDEMNELVKTIIRYFDQFVK